MRIYLVRSPSASSDSIPFSISGIERLARLLSQR